MSAIKIENLTKDYGDRRGCFNVSFEIKDGEVFGFLGPNGAGKTTTIRHLLGFIKPDSGNLFIDGVPVWENAWITNSKIGYLPGEINFPDKMTGMEIIKWNAEMRGTKDMDKAHKLLEYFELNPNGRVKKMSKGMKQKIGIVCAFMHDSKILILDEPTSGLDPLMQERFVELVAQEKAQGKTILMSSHMFAEVEKTCDRVAIIKQGEIATQVDMNDIKKSKKKEYKIKFSDGGDSQKFAKLKFDFTEINYEKNRVRVRINGSEINRLVAALSGYQLNYITEVKMTLEDYFMQFYSKSETKGGKNLSKPLLKKTIKENYMLWLVITTVLVLFLVLLLAAMGGASGGNSSAIHTILQQYFTLFAVMMPLIYIAVTANKLVAAQIDNGSLGYVMAHPIKRGKVVLTQAAYLTCSVAAMFAVITAVGLILIHSQGLAVETGAFLLLCMGGLLLMLATSGISFLASCAFNSSGKSLSIGIGIPIAFFLFGILSTLFAGMAEFLQYFKFITINTFLNPEHILSYSMNIIWEFLAMTGIAAVCYAAAAIVFKKKDLPL